MSKLGKLFKIQLIDYFHLNNWKKRVVVIGKTSS